MTNSQIQARLTRAYRKEYKEDERFKDFLTQNGKTVDFEPELCYIPEFKKGEQYLFLDERKGFEATKTYLIDKKECEAAIEKICDQKGNFIVNKESALDFFKTYYPLYNRLFHQWNFRAFHPFRHFFFYLINWREFYLMGTKAQEALTDLNPYNEDDIEDWLHDYNRLYFCNSIFWPSFPFELVDSENHLYQIKRQSTYYLQGKEITACIEFGQLYTKYHK